MFDLSDTICAISTPPGVGGIAAIRISGKDAWEIANKIFSPARSFIHMHARYGYILDDDKKIDEVVILPFKAPRSFTAEDVVEIYCHGGRQIVSGVLELCLKNGARQAKAGEFTFRAFINGRIDLTEAEAINEITHADNAKLVYRALEVLSGSLREKINIFREKLFNLVTTIESSIEFPMDVSSTGKEIIVRELHEMFHELNLLIESSKEGQILREGVKVSIIGAPNVGKSSLLNRLLENQRAIVSSEAGTTRDTIEEKIIIDDYPVVLVDTAGIRESKAINTVENFGIERSKAALENSEIALVVFDLTDVENKALNKIFNLLDGKPKIVVGNKVDLIQNSPARGGKTRPPKAGPPSAENSNCNVCISAKYGTNVNELKKMLVEKIKNLNGNVKSNQCVYLNQRQKELLTQCASSVKIAVEVSNKGLPEDLIADELKKAISKLDEVTGEKVNDQVIKNIFTKFCIGK